MIHVVEVVSSTWSTTGKRDVFIYLVFWLVVVVANIPMNIQPSKLRLYKAIKKITVGKTCIKLEF